MKQPFHNKGIHYSALRHNFVINKSLCYSRLFLSRKKIHWKWLKAWHKATAESPQICRLNWLFVQSCISARCRIPRGNNVKQITRWNEGEIFFYSQWVFHLGFPITETQLHILKKQRGLHWKLRVDSSRQEKCLLRGYFDFWITHGGTRCCVYLRLPGENILFSNRIFINILPLSVPCRHSKEWMHYAVHKCFFEKAIYSDFFTFRFAGVTPQPSHVFSKASWHCGFILFGSNL